MAFLRAAARRVGAASAALHRCLGAPAALGLLSQATTTQPNLQQRSGSSGAGGGGATTGEQRWRQQRHTQPRATAQDIKAQGSCADVRAALQGGAGTGGGRPSMYALSAALDHMVRVSQRLTPADEAAVHWLHAAATAQLDELNAWTLVALIRFTTHFKLLLRPGAAWLADWQQALSRQEGREQLSGQDTGNALLSLGTLAESDPALRAAADLRLAARLLQHTARLVDGADVASGGPRLQQDAANAVYGAALLGLQPATGFGWAEVEALYGAAWRDVRNLHPINVVQLVLGPAKLMSVGGDDLEPPTPDQDPWHIYYPGNERNDALLSWVGVLASSGRLPVRDAAQVLGGCGTQGYKPAPAVLEALLSVVARGQSLLSVNGTAALNGCAKLGVHPGSTVIQRCFNVVAAGGDSRGLANTLVALSTLGACIVPMWDTLVGLLSKRTDVVMQELHMVYRAYLFMRAQYGAAAVAMPGQLGERILQAHLADVGQQMRSSHLQDALAEAVQRLAGGAEVATEYVVREPGGEGRVSVDVALPELRIVIEADGPRHFLRNVPGRPDGSTWARNSLLAAWGQHVISVPHTQWSQAYGAGASHEQLVGVLADYLRQDIDLPALLRSRAAGASPAA